MTVSSKKGELMIYGVCIVASVFLLFSIKDLPSTARNFPQFSMIALIVVAGFGVVKTLLHGKVDGGEKLDGSGIRKFVYTLLMSVIFVMSIKYLGFYLAAFIYLTCLMYLLNIRKIKVVLLTNVVFLVCIYFVFSVFLNVPIDKGLFL